MTQSQPIIRIDPNTGIDIKLSHPGAGLYIRNDGDVSAYVGIGDQNKIMNCTPPREDLNSIDFDKDLSQYLNKEDDMNQVDISSEEYRIYTYPDGSIFKIDEPISLVITDSGSHRVIDKAGLTHRPTPGFVGISWKPRDGAAPFVV